MVAVPLTSGAYSAESYIASAQRSVNLFAEKNPPEVRAPQPVTQYARPGLRFLNSAPAPAPGRCLYRATNGDLYAVVGVNVYYIDRNWVWTLVGALVTVAGTPVYMADNGTNIIVVDGSPQGYQIQMTTRQMTQIGDPNFLGSTAVDFIDGFLIFNDPGTNEWYSSLSQQVAFNALFVGVKTAWPDNILRVVAIEREVWIFGPQKSEVWYNSGGVPFPFQILPGVIIEQGCAAQYSPAKMDTNVYWLSESPEGDRMVMRGNNQNVAQRISTHAMENEFHKYPRVGDAIGSVYQINGHSFYKLHFPTADKTWGYDQATEQWHEDNWIDTNGAFHRARNTFNAFAYGKNLGLDWATGTLYQIDINYAKDDSTATASQPIVWVRSFPHTMNEMKRLSHSRFIADVQTGTDPNTGETDQLLSPWAAGFSSGFGPMTKVKAPTIGMRYSKDGGNKYSNNRFKQGMSAGHYRALMRYPSMGIARDMVYELSSTAEMSPALNGAYVDVMEGST